MRALVMLAVLGCANACTVVEGDRILGRDLARADAAFEKLPPDLMIGFSPVAGATRVLDGARLSLLARQYGLSEPGVSALCFERRTELLTEERLRPVLERELGPETKLEILDFSRYPVPPGELVFSRMALKNPPAQQDAPVLWRGQVRYGASSTAMVWAKVHVARLETWIETAAAIEAHKAIAPEQIAVKHGWRFPFASPAVADLNKVIGQQTARSLAAGQMITRTMLLPPNEVNRGDLVDVELTSGGVSLRFTARSEGAGHRNEALLVSATDTGRRFQARIQEKGKVRIDADVRRRILETAGINRGADRARDPGLNGRETEEGQPAGGGLAARPVPR